MLSLDAFRGQSAFEHLTDRILHWVTRFLTVHDCLRVRAASFTLSSCVPRVHCAVATCDEAPASSTHVCTGCTAPALRGGGRGEGDGPHLLRAEIETDGDPGHQRRPRCLPRSRR